MGDKMYLKIHDSQRGRIVAVCDADLLGKVLEDQGRELDLDKYRSFYAGEKVGHEPVRKALGRFGSANLVGKRAVEVALSMGLADAQDVMYIKNIPYMQIYRI